VFDPADPPPLQSIGTLEVLSELQDGVDHGAPELLWRIADRDIRDAWGLRAHGHAAPERELGGSSRPHHDARDTERTLDQPLRASVTVACSHVLVQGA
jgi:hypothetical protein